VGGHYLHEGDGLPGEGGILGRPGRGREGRGRVVWGKERSEHIGGGEQGSRRGRRMALEYDDCVGWQTGKRGVLESVSHRTMD
jgi:hypothetical protein